MEFSTDCLPASQILSDLHNLTMAKAMGLIFSLFDIASAQEMPFVMSLYIQCILHGLTRVILCVPFIFAYHKKCWFCGWHEMASIRNGNRP